MHIILGDGRMVLHVQHPDGAEGYEQSFDLEGADHDPIDIYVTPQIFLDVMSSGSSERTTMHYDTEYTRPKPRLYFSGPSGYQAWMPHLRDMKAS